MDLKGRNFLTLKDFTPEEILGLLDLAADLKAKKKKGIPVNIHQGKILLLYSKKLVLELVVLLKLLPTILVFLLHI